MTVPPTTAGSDAGPVILRNAPQAVPAPQAPLRDDGGRWRFEMIYNGGTRRAYAQTPSALVEALIPGYRGLTGPTDTAAARIRLACDLQVRRQAELAMTAQFDHCSTEEQAVLLGDFSTPPAVTRWDAAVPLVLVRTFYQPEGTIPCPQGEALLWLDPSDDWELLASLAEAGAITVSELDDASTTTSEPAAEL
jgi:hypothetical protein